MTNPIDLSAIVPSKAKTWVSLIGALLTIIGPWILQSANLLPSPWPGVIGLIFAVLTAAGVYKADYKPEGTVLAVDPSAPVIASSVPATAPVATPSHQVSKAPFDPDRPASPWTKPSDL